MPHQLRHKFSCRVGGGRQSKRNMSRHCNALITQDHTPMDAACWNLKTHNSLLQLLHNLKNQNKNLQCFPKSPSFLSFHFPPCPPPLRTGTHSLAGDLGFTAVEKLQLISCPFYIARHGAPSLAVSASELLYIPLQLQFRNPAFILKVRIESSNIISYCTIFITATFYMMVPSLITLFKAAVHQHPLLLSSFFTALLWLCDVFSTRRSTQETLKKKKWLL